MPSKKASRQVGWFLAKSKWREEAEADGAKSIFHQTRGKGNERPLSQSRDKQGI